MSRRMLIAFFIFVLTVGPTLAQVDQNRIRFGFFPKHGEDLVYRIDFAQENQFNTQAAPRKWSHEVVINISGEKPPDQVTGHFTIRNVTEGEGARSDPLFAIAKAIEGERFGLTMLSYGVPVEVDWPAIRSRVEMNMGRTAEPRLAAVMPQVLAMFPADGVEAVLRPFWVTSIPHLRTFARDGTTTTETDLELPAYYPVKRNVLQTTGGRSEGTDDLLFVWKLTSDPKAAAEALAPQLRGLAAAIASPAEESEVRRLVEEAIAAGIDVVEVGFAEFDLTPGLIRKTMFQARLIAGSFRSETTIVITRLAPE